MMALEPGLESEAFKTHLEDSLKQLDPHGWSLKAWEHYLALGLPSRKTELYRYIKLRQLFSKPFQLPLKCIVSFEQIAPYIQPECTESVLVFLNGEFSPALSRTSAIPKQVTISTLQEATITFSTFLNNHWTKSLKEEPDAFAALNGALHRQGAFIYIPPKTIIETPIQILHILDNDNQWCMHAPRLNVFAGAQSQVSLISTKQNLCDNGYFINQVVEFSLEENAKVHYSQILCDEHPEAWHLEALRATLKRNASLTTVCATEGSATVRTDYRVSLIGENAEVLLNGVWMLKDKRESHVNVYIEHQAPHCRSFQLFKGVLNDFSRSSFEGKIMVRRPAQKTEAFQLNNNLLLSDHAHADSKPNLEIFADDVKASHGATVGQLDQEQMFYMKTRGFEDAAAKNLLIYGFCEQVVEQFPTNTLKTAVSDRIRNYMLKD